MKHPTNIFVSIGTESSESEVDMKGQILFLLFTNRYA